MTVPATTRRAGPFNGNGSTTIFPFDFRVFAAADVQVTLADADDIETVQVIATDYTVTLNPDQDTDPGGAITMLTAPATGETLVITGAVPYDQTLDLPAGGRFSPRALENALDRTVIQVQQLKELLARALTVPVTADVLSTELPAPEGDALIGWDTAGTRLINRTISELVSGSFYSDWKADTFTGDGVATTFLLAYAPGNVNVLDVSISGVTQVPEIDYTLSGNRVYFTSAPPAASTILVRYSFALVTEEPPEDWGFITDLATETADYGTI